MRSIVETEKITERAAKQIWQAAHVVGMIASVLSAIYIWARFGVVGDFLPILVMPIAFFVGASLTFIFLIALLLARISVQRHKFGVRSGNEK